MKLGIIGAMESEVKTLIAALGNPTFERVSSMDFACGQLGNSNVVVARAGVGKVNAAVCAQTLIVHFGVDAIVNTGVAGSLDSRLGIGSVVLGTDAVQHDMDVTVWGYAPGQVPSLDVWSFELDENLRAVARRAVAQVAPEATVLEGRVASGDLFVGTEEAKRRIAEGFGALCCEMEGAAIAQACYLNDTPCVIVRMISDNADSVAPETFETEMAKRCAAVVQRMSELM